MGPNPTSPGPNIRSEHIAVLGLGVESGPVIRFGTYQVLILLSDGHVREGEAELRLNGTLPHVTATFSGCSKAYCGHSTRRRWWWLSEGEYHWAEFRPSSIFPHMAAASL